MTGPIRSEASEFIRTITLDSAPGNTIDGALRVKLIELLTMANHDWDTRVIVLESALPGVFSLGEDHAGPRPPADEPRDSFGVPSTGDALVRHALRAVWDAKWPLIAKVEGAATGNGLLLAALADVAVVSEDALLGLIDARANVVNGAAVLRRCLSEQAMRYLILSGRTVPARQLRALGCGMTIVPADQVDATVDALARDIAAHDPHLLRHMKISLTEIEGDAALAGHAVEQRYTALVRAKLG
jgi:enoyl-CoA hydratase/carnithine racemase